MTVELRSGNHTVFPGAAASAANTPSSIVQFDLNARLVGAWIQEIAVLVRRNSTSGKFSRPFGLPAEYRADARYAWGRLKGLINHGDAGVELDADRRIEEVVTEIRRFHDAAKEQLDNRETPAEQ